MKRTVPALLSVVLMLPLGGTVADAAFPGDNGAITFARFSNDQNDIWAVKPSGKKVRLTDTPKRSEGLADWNAAGTHIAYTKCGLKEFTNCDIWVMEADGSNQTRLTETPNPVQETWPTWSPDGTMIAYTSNAEDVFQDIWVMNADGTEQTRLTVNEAFDAFPEWSPDGTKIAFTSDLEQVDDIWTMAVDGTDRVRLTSGEGIDERPDWSPDGTQLLFSRDGNIWRVDADGTDLTKLTATRRHEFAPTFSPNGLRIAFNK
ncbi:MAG TPA: hypothetical protein VFS18_04760, partial [Actinomycetota bacterium]|nr:hypothetical protein [Actinomycetota bacterium]